MLRLCGVGFLIGKLNAVNTDNLPPPELVPAPTAPGTVVVPPGPMTAAAVLRPRSSTAAAATAAPPRVLLFGPGVYWMAQRGASHLTLNPATTTVYLAPGAYVKVSYHSSTTRALI